MPPESHRLMDKALHVDRRENSRYWQCSFCLGSRNHRQTTRESALQPPRILRGWHMERCVEDRRRRRGGAPLLDGPVNLSLPDPPRRPMAGVGERHRSKFRGQPRRREVCETFYG